MRAPALLRSLQRAGSVHLRPATPAQAPSLLPCSWPRNCAGAERGAFVERSRTTSRAHFTSQGTCSSSCGGSRVEQAAIGAGEASSSRSLFSGARCLGVKGFSGLNSVNSVISVNPAGPSRSVGGKSLSNPAGGRSLAGESLSKAASRQRRSQQHPTAIGSAMAPPLSTLLEGGGRVLSIQSHTVQGYVGNKSAVFPLQILGFDVDSINSVQFSNHTAYPVFKGQVLNGEQLWELIEGLEANNLLHYTHLLTGYVGSLSFLETILRVLEKLREVNPDLKYVCDPVLGDEGQLYVKPELVQVYREKVVPAASLLTPNQFEAELLTGVKIDSEEAAFRACDALHQAGPAKVVITSIDEGPDLLVVGSDKVQGQGPTQRFRLRITKIPSYFTGTGDLLTALLLGWSHKHPNDLGKAIELSVASVQAVLKRTLRDYAASGLEVPEKEHELRLIQSREELLAPPVTLPVERLN